MITCMANAMQFFVLRILSCIDRRELPLITFICSKRGRQLRGRVALLNWTIGAMELWSVHGHVCVIIYFIIIMFYLYAVQRKNIPQKRLQNREKLINYYYTYIVVYTRCQLKRGQRKRSMTLLAIGSGMGVGGLSSLPFTTVQGVA